MWFVTPFDIFSLQMLFIIFNYLKTTWRKPYMKVAKVKKFLKIITTKIFIQGWTIKYPYASRISLTEIKFFSNSVVISIDHFYSVHRNTTDRKHKETTERTTGPCGKS